MKETKDEIIFDDPELDAELNAETGKDEPQEPVELPESRERWTPSGALFPGAEVINPGQYYEDGQPVDAPSPETVDPDSMNFLLEKQKQILEPDPEGAVPVGGGYRAPSFEELEQVLEDGLSCEFCGEAFTPEDCDPHDLGQLVYYGHDEKGHRKVWHWSCLALWMLIICKGHPEQAADHFHVDIRDLRGIKSSYRAIPWGRLGFRTPGTEGGRK